MTDIEIIETWLDRTQHVAGVCYKNDITDLYCAQTSNQDDIFVIEAKTLLAAVSLHESKYGETYDASN